VPVTSTTSVSPVFVVGVFRSGTSLLYSLLNQHPQIALMYECDVWDFPGPFFGQRFNGEWLERQEFYNRALSRHRLVFGGSTRGLEEVRTPDDLYRCHSQNKGAVLWGEKSPVYSTHLGALASRYPHGSFILIWRDPVEIYRSIKVAGQKCPFFGRPGMLHRLIYQQEKMIREAAQLQRTGARIHHVNYDGLVDNTADVCHGVCTFLRVDFEPRMTGLQEADFSAVYQEPQHDFLRRGVIERQPLANTVVEPAIARKLTRFRKRWERLAGRPLGLQAIPRQAGEPRFDELFFHRTAGAVLHAGDGFKRLGFEFLPLPWLRTYRLFKSYWLRAYDGSGRQASLGVLLRQHRITVMAGFITLALVAFIDYIIGPEISCGPLYLIPCAVLALVVGRSWATIAALASALSVTLFGEGLENHFHSMLTATMMWNVAMRFIFFEIFVLLLDRIRRDLTSETNPRNGSAHK
jgi:hypothetical protein